MTDVSRPLAAAVAVPRAAPAGSGVRDATVATAAAALLCAALAARVGPSVPSLLGLAAGVGIVIAAGASVVGRPGRWSGPADRVTLARAVLAAGCATVSGPMLTGGLDPRPWLLVVLLAPALALDAVDGRVARLTGTSSSWGGRLDGEMDAALLLVVSLALVPALGVWVSAIGLMRYAYWAAGWVRPRLRFPLGSSPFRRTAAAVQGVALLVAAVPAVPLAAAAAVTAAALVLLSVSFASCVVLLERRVPAGG